MLKQADEYSKLKVQVPAFYNPDRYRRYRDLEWAFLCVAKIAEVAEHESAQQRNKHSECRSKTLLRSMIAALDASDEATFFDCFEELQKVMLEMTGATTQGKP